MCGSIHAALEFVARARSHLPLDDQVARLDLKEPRAFLHVFCTALDRQTAFQAKGHSGAGAVGQRIDHALAKKTTLAEKGERPAFEQAAGLVGEARDPEGMRGRIRHAAIRGEKVGGFAWHFFVCQQEHGRVVVRDRDRVGQLVASGAARDCDSGQRGQVAGARGNAGPPGKRASSSMSDEHPISRLL